jgi:Putative auto-transporter adhesin, head GIN domain
MHTISISILALAALAAPGAFAETTKTYDLKGFDEIQVAAGMEAEFVTAPTYSVVLTFLRGDPDNVIVKMDGTRLKISHKASFGWNNRVQAKARISGPGLKAIDASSGAELTVTGLNATTLSIGVSSGASVDVSGTCDTLVFSASSGADADLKDLVCETAAINASSGASATITATQSATSDASSGASVDVYGNPASRKANKSMSGGETTFRS